MRAFVDPITWDALATLVTGIAAVGGAVIIGRRQTAIAARQIEIQALSARTELFERRYQIYDAVRTAIGHVMRTGQHLDRDQEIAFLEALHLSRLLFSDDVHGRLRALWGDFTTLRATQRGVREGDPEEERLRLIDREAAVFAAITERLKDLPSMFGDELRLSGGS